MKKVIWKFQVPLEDEVHIPMPVGAKIIHVASQYGVPCMWALINETQANSHEREVRWFHVVGTGHLHDESWFADDNYIGTSHTTIGPLSMVWHIFEETT